MMGFVTRELYCPAHFGNSYEVMSIQEIRDMLKEALWWGYNEYGDWFDAADLRTPYDAEGYLLPQVLWERKVKAFQVASELGFRINLLITPNQVFLDQLESDCLADKSDERVFRQLLCPSKSKGRDIILENYKKLFEYLACHGVSIHSITALPYDYGGCACEDCKPWIVTFGKLSLDILDIAERYFSNLQARLNGWWWSKEEHEIFKRWADKDSYRTFSSIALHIPYGHVSPDDSIALPEGCSKGAFVHIGYGDKAQPRDVYGPWGPVVAANRLERTILTLREQGYQSFTAYSEGLFDDINKAIAAGIGSNQFRNAKEVLEAYVERYFGIKGSAKSDWADWIAGWGEPFDNDVVEARKQLDLLSKDARDGWRLRQLESKLKLFEYHANVKKHDKWDDYRMEQANRFFSEREYLQRNIWGLGLIRHVLNERFWQPDWYEEWALHVHGTADFAKASDEA